jgi:uncharacterized membrane protein
MNVKRIFGIILTVLGIIGLIYTASTFMSTKGSTYDIKLLAVYGILGFLFFVSGIGLIKGTKDTPT